MRPVWPCRPGRGWRVCRVAVLLWLCGHRALLRRLAPMRLYTLSKRHFVLVFVVFFICFGLTVFVGIRGEFSF